jgi:hypothetical protein
LAFKGTHNEMRSKKGLVPPLLLLSESWSFLCDFSV